MSTISPDILQGGSNATLHESPYRLFEEEIRNTEKETSTMLRAGAKGVYCLQNDEAGLKNGSKELKKLIAKKAGVVCESNSLDQCVKSELLVVMVVREN